MQVIPSYMIEVVHAFETWARSNGYDVTREIYDNRGYDAVVMFTVPSKDGAGCPAYDLQVYFDQRVGEPSGVEYCLCAERAEGVPRLWAELFGARYPYITPEALDIYF